MSEVSPGIEKLEIKYLNLYDLQKIFKLYSSAVERVPRGFLSEKTEQDIYAILANEYSVSYGIFQNECLLGYQLGIIRSGNLSCIKPRKSKINNRYFQGYGLVVRPQKTLNKLAYHLIKHRIKILLCHNLNFYTGLIHIKNINSLRLQIHTGHFACELSKDPLSLNYRMLAFPSRPISNSKSIRINNPTLIRQNQLFQSGHVLHKVGQLYEFSKFNLSNLSLRADAASSAL